VNTVGSLISVVSSDTLRSKRYWQRIAIQKDEAAQAEFCLKIRTVN